MSKQKRKIGEVPPHRVPVYDGKGHLRGNVSPHATAVGAARMSGTLGHKLTIKDGRPAWTLADTSAAGTTEGAPAALPESSK